MRACSFIILSTLFMTSIPTHSQPAQTSPAAVSKQLSFNAKREESYVYFIQSKVEPFWQKHIVTGQFQNNQQLNIHYAYSNTPDATKTIVISPGRVEGYLKYKELMYDLVQQGFSVYVIDHQGQGLSSRRLDNPHKGYVESFDDYVNDLHQFIENIVLPNQNNELVLLGHSMGCAIGLRYIQVHPDVFKRALFSSPMWGFISGSIPDGIAKAMINTVNWFSDVFLPENPYFLGGDDYHNVPFPENQLTSSKKRYDYFRYIYNQQPKLQLGSITFSWLKESVDAIDQAFAELDKVKTPILVLQAEADSIIKNQSHVDFYDKLNHLHPELNLQPPITIKQGQHELFIESDPIRNQVMTHIINFFH